MKEYKRLTNNDYDKCDPETEHYTVADDAKEEYHGEM